MGFSIIYETFGPYNLNSACRHGGFHRHPRCKKKKKTWIKQKKNKENTTENGSTCDIQKVNDSNKRTTLPVFPEDLYAERS